MDYTRKSYLLEQHPHHLPHLNTSFSSSLLDEIYKSFDETTTYKSSASFEETTRIMKKKMSTQTCIAPVTTTRTSTNKNHSNGASVRAGGGGGGIIRDFAVKEECTGRLKQRNVVDKWVLEKKKKKKKKGNEKKIVESNNNKIHLRKKPASVPVDTHRYFHSTSSSYDSSSGGGFSSSETESVYGSKPTLSTKSATKSASASFCVKPIGTRGSSAVHHSVKTDQILRNQSKFNGDESRSGGGKARSRAIKIYNDLIKVKQPISPGGKISSFLNSLFTPKKSSNLVGNNGFPATTKSTFTRTAPPVAAAATPTCSSASRSCFLSKTPSLSNGNMKQRSVRFYPVNIIVDEQHQESKPSREQSHRRHHYQQRSRNGEEEFKNKISKIKNNHQKLLIEQVIDIDKLLERNYHDNLEVEEDDYDDNRASYASSDLFELENLSTIGLEKNAVVRFSEELPVYETTHFETNRAIANGFRL